SPQSAEIHFSGENINIEQASELALKIFPNSRFVRKLFSILRKGLAPQVRVNFKGDDVNSLFEGENLYLKGNVRQGEVRIPGTSLIVNNITGKTEIKNSLMDIDVSQGMLGTSILKQGKLKLDLFNYEHIPFDGEFFLEADLSMVPRTLITLMPTRQLANELKKVHNIRGRVNTRLNLVVPVDSENIEVTVDAPQFSCTGNYERIPGTTSVEHTHFTFHDGKAGLKNLKGTICGIDIDSVDAVLDFNKEATVSIQSGSGEIPFKSVLPLILAHPETKELISPIKSGSGSIFVTSVNFKGPLLIPGKWIYDIKGHTKALDLTTNPDHEEIKNLAFEYHLYRRQASKSDKPTPERLFLKRISADIASLSESLPSVDKKYRESIRVPFKFENGYFETNEHSSRLNGDIKFSDGPKLKIELKIKPKIESDGKNIKEFDLKKITLIDSDVSNAAIELNPNNDQHKYIFSGTLNTNSLLDICRPGSYLHEKITTLTKNEPVVIYTDQDLNLNILIKSLDMTPMLTSQDSDSISFDSSFFSNPVIQLKSSILNFKRWKVTDIEAQISHQISRGPPHTTILLNNAGLCDIQASGHIKLDNNEAVYINLPFKAQNKENIQDLLNCFFGKKQLMNGTYSLVGKIETNALKKDISSSLNGSFQLEAQEGRIYKLTLLSRILSLVNVSTIFKGKLPDITQQGFAYTDLLIEADIKQSIIHIKKAVVKGVDMTLFFTGRVDIMEDNMDMTVLVSPFKTIDSLLEKIPLINTLMDGRLITIPIKATGPISDPVVVPLHPSAVGETIGNIMKKIVGTPFQMLDRWLED
ncbi:MAG: hypothetical protein HN417_11280, partial [Desulfobacula sp.]|nr:hypothetical protein [Desulfobacula sp.]